jgi:chromate transporter
VTAGRTAGGSPVEVLGAFLKLGLTSFGGPVAHLGYFRDEFVERRGWLDERAFTDLIALCQFLPGPASSQVGFAIGLIRAGALGGLAAWVGFTFPSALAMTLFAYGAGSLKGPAGDGLLNGLRLVAVAIVAQAVLGMARTLAPDRPRASIAILALILPAFAPSGISQIGAILLGALAGLVVCRQGGETADGDLQVPISRRMGVVFLIAFFALLALSFLPARDGAFAFLAAVTRSGALVFGGGHVVLPLLHSAVVAPGFVSDNAFLAGYGAAQAMPGPLFTFAAYLGAVAGVPRGVPGAALALTAIFAPGMLILMGTLPFWHALRARSEARAALAGINAAVVGLLASALYDPVWTSAVKGRADFAVAAAGFTALVVWGTPPIAVVLLTAAAGMALAVA